MAVNAAGVGAGSSSLLPLLGAVALATPAVLAMSYAVGGFDSIALPGAPSSDPGLERDRMSNAAIRAAGAPAAFDAGVGGGASRPRLNLFGNAALPPQQRQADVDVRIAPLLEGIFRSASGGAPREAPALPELALVADLAPGPGQASMRLASAAGVADAVAPAPQGAGRSSAAPLSAGRGARSGGDFGAGGGTAPARRPAAAVAEAAEPPQMLASADPATAPYLQAPAPVAAAPTAALAPAPDAQTTPDSTPPAAVEAPGRTVQTEGTTHLADETVSSAGGFLFQGGDVRGNGAFDGQVHVDGATLAAGNSPGALFFETGLTFSSGVLEVEFATLESHDFYDVTGTAEFTGGLFSFVFFEGFSFEAGFQIGFLVADDIVGFDGAPPVAYQYAGAGQALGAFDVFLEVFQGRERLVLAFAPTPLRPADNGPAAQASVETPEPAAVGLFGLALLAILYAHRRRNRTEMAA